jgi:acyl carrier protein
VAQQLLACRDIVAAVVLGQGLRGGCPDVRLVKWRVHFSSPWAANRDRGDMTTADNQLLKDVAALLVEALNLETAPEDIDPQAPLYGDGLGLDSIDILEVALVVSKRYGFQLRSDDENNLRIFASLASLADHVAAHRTL